MVGHARYSDWLRMLSHLIGCFQELEEAGFTADCASALGFKFINQDALWGALQNHAGYDGLILTSQRAVQAIHKVLDAHKGTFEADSHLTISALLLAAKTQ